MSRTTRSEPLVTVGLPVYNGERYVGDAIDSILGQSFQDFRLLIADNASTDATADICRDYARQDARIEYIRNPRNLGMAGNYRLVFGLCRSKYFRWATADDYSGPEMLAEAVRVMEADSGLSLCYPRAYFVDGAGRELSRWSDELHLVQDDPVERFRGVLEGIGRVHHHLGLMRTSCVRQTGLLTKHVASDVVFVAEMSLYGKLYQIPEYQFYRRMHEDSSSWDPGSEKHQARRYHAASVNRIPFNRARLHGRLVECVQRSPLSSRDKSRAYRFLARRVFWDRAELARELIRELRIAAGHDPF